MEILLYPHPALRRVARPVREINDQVREIIHQMLDLMYEAKGIGLAANQVGLPIRLFVMNETADRENGEELVFVNPEIVDRKGIIEDEEGCLSFPGLYAKVKRAERIKVRAMDRDGHGFELDLEGMPARIVQHEFDHLKGVLFTDKISPLERVRVVAQVKEMERVYREAQKNGEVQPNAELEKQLDQVTATFL